MHGFRHKVRMSIAQRPADELLVDLKLVGTLTTTPVTCHSVKKVYHYVPRS